MTLNNMNIQKTIQAFQSKQRQPRIIFSHLEKKRTEKTNLREILANRTHQRGIKLRHGKLNFVSLSKERPDYVEFQSTQKIEKEKKLQNNEKEDLENNNNEMDYKNTIKKKEKQPLQMKPVNQQTQFQKKG